MSDDLTAFAHDVMPFTVVLGMTVLEAGPERVVVRGEWTSERCTSAGVLHGGYVMSLVDSAGAMCAFYNLPEGAAGTSTIESKTNFFRAVRAGSVTVTAAPVHAGRTTIVIQTDATDDDGKLVSRSIQTQAVLGG